MKLLGTIERYEFSPANYFFQSKLKCWVNARPKSKAIVVEVTGSSDELTRKYQLPVLNSSGLNSIVGRQCQVGVSGGLSRLIKVF
jgi:hypothetical protein